MTKLVTSVACIQLIEAGLDVDSPSVIEKYLPELCAQPILKSMDGKVPVTKPRTQPITLRHLLTHTNGTRYTFVDNILARWEAAKHHRGWTARGSTLKSIEVPLLFEPGSTYAYGLGLDWAGVLVERVSGLTLEDYFRANIFNKVPGGCRSMSFYPTRGAKRRAMAMTTRNEKGEVVLDPGHRDVWSWDPIDIKFRSGGAGLVGTLKDYLSFLQELLACYQGKEGVLSPKGGKMLFDDAFPERGVNNTAHKKLGRMLKDMGQVIPGWTSGEDVTHSLAMCVNTKDSPNGRRAGSAMCESNLGMGSREGMLTAGGGAARTQQWIDPKTGIIVSHRWQGKRRLTDFQGLLGTQILEPDQSAFVRVLDDYERTVYGALEVKAKL